MGYGDVSVGLGYLDSDSTVVARATPEGSGALAIVRITGSRCQELLRSWGLTPEHKVATRVKVTSTAGVQLDDAVLIFWRAPATPTGEDLIEVMLHGAPSIVDSVIADIASRPGFRRALPGEFSFRAHANGKLSNDGVVDLFKTFQVGGGSDPMARSFEEKIKQLRSSLMEVLLKLEAAIDFDDQGIRLNDFNPQWAKFVDKLSEFCRVVVAQGEFLREPLVMLAGMPNVGKSSLINLLAGRDVSIVNETAGTTRDLVTARLKLGQLQVSVVDTAGIRSDADSEIEAQGIGRAVGLSKTALVIWVADATRLQETLQALHSGPVGNISGVLINKADLVDVGEVKDVGHPWRLVSAKMDSGHSLSEGISEWISSRLEGFSVPDQTWKISILSEALDIAREAGQSSAAQDGLWDLVVSDIRRVERRLADLVGPIDRQDLLNEIFMRMCIGK